MTAAQSSAVPDGGKDAAELTDTYLAHMAYAGFGIVCDDTEAVQYARFVIAQDRQRRAAPLALPDGGKGEAVAEVVNKYGDPDAFAERDLVIQEEVLKTLPIGTKLYAAPQANCAASDASAEQERPFGWVMAKGGNYFTRNESSAKRIGGLTPVFTRPASSNAQAECAHKFVPYYEGVQLCEKCKTTQAECAPRALTDEEILKIECEVAYLAKSRDDLTIKTVRECIEQAVNKGVSSC